MLNAPYMEYSLLLLDPPVEETAVTVVNV